MKKEVIANATILVNGQYIDTTVTFTVDIDPSLSEREARWHVYGILKDASIGWGDITIKD